MTRAFRYFCYTFLFAATLVVGTGFDEGVRNVKFLPDQNHVDRCEL